MEDQTTLNARIKSTHLGFEDHGILTIWIHLEFEHSGQGFGGFVLDDKPLEEDRGQSGYRRQPSALAGRSITGILQALDVTSWEKLAGTYVRIRKDGGWSAPITHIGHIIKDRWFSFVEAAKAEKLRDQQITMSIINTVAPAVKVEEVLPEKARHILERIDQAPRNKRYFTEGDRVMARDVLATFPTAAIVKDRKEAA